MTATAAKLLRGTTTIGQMTTSHTTTATIGATATIAAATTATTGHIAKTVNNAEDPEKVRDNLITTVPIAKTKATTTQELEHL